VLFLTGMLVMAYNLWRTVRVADVAMAEREAQIA
jgi:cytochrome c oxidase cbb3-type subunit 1